MRAHGLLSTEALLRRIGQPPAEIERLTTQRRRARVVFDPTPLGRVVLNDNIPLSESKLAPYLDDGLSPADWLRMLNQRVFFWVAHKKMKLLRDARANQRDRREVLVFDTLGLVGAHAERVEIAPFNTGNTLHRPVRRGLSTFTPLRGMSYADWRRKRMPPNLGLDHIVEVLIRDGVPDIERHLIERREVVSA